MDALLSLVLLMAEFAGLALVAFLLCVGLIVCFGILVIWMFPVRADRWLSVNGIFIDPRRKPAGKGIR